MDEPVKMRNFQIFVLNPSANSIITHYVYSYSDDLVQKIKNAKFEDDKWIVWDKGCLRVDAIVGIIEQ